MRRLVGPEGHDQLFYFAQNRRMTESLTIWCNADLPLDVMSALVKGTYGHRLLIDEQRGGNLAAGGASSQLAEADVAFGQPDPVQVMELPNLKWVQLTSAGYTRYDRADLRNTLRQRHAHLTNSSSVFDEPCAQHLAAFMLAQARQIPQSLAAQNERMWNYEPLRAAVRLLSGETVLLLGFGAIARRLVQLLQPFNLEIMAVRQSVRGDEPVPAFTIGELDRLLPHADHIVNILPASPSTDGLMDASKFALAKPGARFYNIGRGTTVDQPALVEALQSGSLAAAYLDVTDPEPLPPDHFLWTAPNCFITPHTGGGFAAEHAAVVGHFLENLRRFTSERPLLDLIV